MKTPNNKYILTQKHVKSFCVGDFVTVNKDINQIHYLKSTNNIRHWDSYAKRVIQVLLLNLYHQIMLYCN